MCRASDTSRATVAGNSIASSTEKRTAGRTRTAVTLTPRKVSTVHRERSLAIRGRGGTFRVNMVNKGTRDGRRASSTTRSGWLTCTRGATFLRGHHGGMTVRMRKLRSFLICGGERLRWVSLMRHSCCWFYWFSERACV